MQYLKPLLTLLFLASINHWGIAQTEAQSVQDVLIFQEKNGEKTIEFEPGDRVVVFNQNLTKDSIKGKLLSFSRDTLQVMNLKTKSKQMIVLDEIRGLSPNDANAGAIVMIALSGPFLLLGMLFGIIAVALIGFVELTFFIIPIVFVAVGILLLALGIRWLKVLKAKILLKLWTRRHVRRKQIRIKRKK